MAEEKLKVGRYYYYNLILNYNGKEGECDVGIVRIKKIIRFGFAKNKNGKRIDNRWKSYCIADVLDPSAMDGPILFNQKIRLCYLGGPVTLSVVRTRKLLAHARIESSYARRRDAVQEF